MTRNLLPRYHAIEQALRRRIGDLRPHAPLPSETALSAEFGVSRMTARGAVMRLANEGLVYREAGRGTFVAPPVPGRRADLLVSFSDEIRRRGQCPTSRPVVARLRDATEDEIGQLRLGREGTVVELRRVRLADQVPVAVDAALLPGSVAAVLDADLTTGSLHAALEQLGRIPSRGHATLSAAAAAHDEVELLGIAPGAPLLVEERLIFDQFDRPLERTVTRYVGERYALAVAFEVDRSGARAAEPQS